MDSTLSEPAAGALEATYAMGIDLGLTLDWSAVVLVHLDAARRVVVDLTRTWRGQKGTPVSLAAVEDEVLRLTRRFPVGRVVVDAWQAQYLVQRLRDHGVRNLATTTIDPAHLDRLATLTK